MIDHITLFVRDLEKSKAFYDRVLAAIGMRVNLGSAEEFFWGYGANDTPEFEIAAGRFFIAQIGPGRELAPRVHVAFRVESEDAVREFHAVALASGAEDNGAPGLRLDYGQNYFAAFVLDPDGNNIEAVTFQK